MKRQKGQSVVEFALIIPLFLLLILGMIYGGFAYADYLQYSTAVREAARDIAMQKAEKRVAIATGLNGNNNASMVKKYADPLTKLYDAKFSVTLQESTTEEPGFVTVSVELNLNEELGGSGFPAKVLPKKLKPLQCTMPIEKDLDHTE
ncbi:TadE/TadG family type IV pilus assembly protein [Selenomonas sp. GACV-9]|uniref:TadE/TadG family type IV pilus assembly protein n=1 Tax=Selenomonas sp. GACV-9 TaxID=3158782 RepID=UPI0015A5D499